MSNEQKLREAIKRLLKAHRITVQAPPKTITEAENQLREIENAVKYAEEALATTEPDHFEHILDMVEPSQPVSLTDEYVVSHLEAAGVKFQRFKGGISGEKDCWSTSGSQDVRKLANGVRAIIDGARQFATALREKQGGV